MSSISLAAEKPEIHQPLWTEHDVASGKGYSGCRHYPACPSTPLRQIHKNPCNMAALLRNLFVWHVC